jgi:hypothetical protein
LSNGTSYTYYVRCSDISGIANSDDFSIQFSIAAPPEEGGPGGPGGTLPGSPAPPGRLKGDCNGDGRVDIFDVSIILRNWEKPNADLSCDFNGDRRIDVFDASIMLRNWTR